MAVLEGCPPYHRPTYRYTPLLAWSLVPNHLLHPAFGKVIFVTLDVLAGLVMYKILSIGNQLSERVKIISCLFWLFNPLTAIVSSRGNAESMLAVLMLTCLYLLMKDQLVASSIVYGLAVHVKIYPIIHCLALYMVIDRTPWEWVPATGKLKVHWGSFISRRRVLFTGISFATCIAVTLFFYMIYGWEFLHENLPRHKD
jgi:phosphatidylinositol glycan class M